jgi:hypothetical protein
LNRPIFAARLTKKQKRTEVLYIKRLPAADKISTEKRRKKIEKSLEVKVKCAYLCSPVETKAL